MQFVYPAYLFGLLLILFPVIIHLFKLRRYRTVYFSNLKFLKDIEQSSRNRSRLRDLLLLVLRILTIIALVLAFAQPYKPDPLGSTKLPGQHIGLFIDASFSMSNVTDQGSVFDQAKKLAVQEVERYPLETTFLLADPENPDRLIIGLDQSQVIDRIARMKLSTRSLTLDQIIGLFDEDITELLVFSDFQRDFITQETFSDSTFFSIRLIPIKARNKQNLYIDSCWLNEPVHHIGSRVFISGSLVNSGNQEYQQFPVTLYVNDSLKGRSVLDLKPQSKAAFSIGFLPDSPGIQKGRITLNDFPVSFDNNFYFSFSLHSKTRICHLFEEDPQPYIRAAFSEDSAFRYDEYPVTAYPKNGFEDYESVIISQTSMIPERIRADLNNFVLDGGNLIIFPPATGKTEKLNQLAEEMRSPVYINRIADNKTVRISKDLKAFYNEISLNPTQSVNWPYLKAYHGFALRGSSSNYNIILETNSGRPVWISKNYGRGQLSLCAFPLEPEVTNLPEHPIFIPVLFYLTTAETRNPLIYQRLASSKPYPVRLDDGISQGVSLFEPNSGIRLIPQQEFFPSDPDIRIYTNEYKGQAGILSIESNNREVAAIALNYPLQESDLSYLTTSELEDYSVHHQKIIVGTNLSPEKTASQSAKFQKGSNPWSFSKILLIIALLLIVGETLLYRSKW